MSDDKNHYEKARCPECLEECYQDELDTFDGLCEECYNPENE